ncbi:GNAT family N-acetyltransferase [Microlunatus soli]|uniref:Acetyltransferase (GNAT) domain-containing protein n=1 Tax=Microlunatus soli TaxID=630515 RepID=A0A1H1YX11_9ACTN|nr:GNAT family N-acetyltransferase [Microlunatus soli]SDT25933.1 Acetyltransferase (GNAT) domain-containing protein [Microlunatus soli]
MSDDHESSGIELLLIGGRSGVGKSTVGAEISAQLEQAAVRHAYIEGDVMDWCYPKRQDLFEKNLSDLTRNYLSFGYRRFVYTNTASVKVADEIAGLMPAPARTIGALLTCEDDTAAARLRSREVGSELDVHLRRTGIVAREFKALRLPDWAIEVSTDGRGGRRHRTPGDHLGRLVARRGMTSSATIEGMGFEVIPHRLRAIEPAAIRRLYEAEGWWPERSESAIGRVLANGPAVGGWDGDQLVGFARAVSDGEFRAYVEDVVVAPSHRGAGVGAALMDGLQAELAGIDVVSLFCHGELPAFYERFGYRFTRQRVGHRPDDQQGP